MTEVTNVYVFNLLETQFCYSGAHSSPLSAEALEHSSCISEKLWIGFAVNEYIVATGLSFFEVGCIQALKE